MKKLFLLLASLVAICSCDKENSSDKENSKIDPSLVNVEIELSCIDEEPDGIYTDHTILCTGNIGGFTGEATVRIGTSSSPYFSTSKSVSVAGESTSFSFTFQGRAYSDYNNKPITFDVEVEGPNFQKLFRSSVVVYL